MNLTNFQKSFKVLLIGVLLVGALFAAIIGGQGVAKNYFAKASTCAVTNVATAQVTTNSAVITWQSQEQTQGRVVYGTNATGLTLNAPEANSAKSHNVPLTLLTPNTTYYYLITIGNTSCDSTGNACEGDKCLPWSFSTSNANAAPNLSPSPSPTIEAPKNSSGSAGAVNFSPFCQKVKANIGKTKTAADWSTVKQYDTDNNGIINGLDVIKCEKSGK